MKESVKNFCGDYKHVCKTEWGFHKKHWKGELLICGVIWGISAVATYAICKKQELKYESSFKINLDVDSENEEES